jgi:phosphonate transport system ATP-binding protein
MTFQLHKVSVHHAGAAGHALALRELDLDVAQGEQIALIGPSGAGKTSLLHTLACALRPASGTLPSSAVLPGNWPAANATPCARAVPGAADAALPPRQRVVNAVLAGRLPQWSLWTAMRSLVAPVDPRAAWEALGQIQSAGQAVCAGRPPVRRRTPALRHGARSCRMRKSSSSTNRCPRSTPLWPCRPSPYCRPRRRSAGHAVCSLHQVEIARACFPRIVALRDGRIVFDLPGAKSATP